MFIEVTIKVGPDGVTITSGEGASSSSGVASEGKLPDKFPTDPSVASQGSLPDTFPAKAARAPSFGGEGDSDVSDNPGPGGNGDDNVSDNPGPGGGRAGGDLIVVGPIVIANDDDVSDNPGPGGDGEDGVSDNPGPGGDGEDNVSDNPGPGGEGSGRRIIVVGPIVITGRGSRRTSVRPPGKEPGKGDQNEPPAPTGKARKTK